VSPIITETEYRIIYLSSGGEGDDLSGLDDTGLDPAHGHCADTADLVNVLNITFSTS
jgi:hypothetical protein